MSSSPREDISLSRSRSGFLYYDVGTLDIHFSEIVFIVESIFGKAIPAGIYLLRVNNRNTRTSLKYIQNLTIKTQKRRQRRRSGVFIVNFKHISYLVLVFLLLTLNM